MKNIKLNDKFGMDVKRLRIPLNMKVNCPHCNKVEEADLSDSYLIYPIINEVETVSQCCSYCGKEFEFDTILRMSVDVDMKTRKTKLIYFEQL